MTTPSFHPLFGSLAATLCLAAAHAQSPYGHGTSNAAGIVPRLRSTQPHLGASWTMSLDRAAPLAPAALSFSLAPADLDLFGSKFLISLLPTDFQGSFVLLTDTNGHAALPTAIPPTATQLVGARLYAQCAVHDTPAPGTLLPTTNGVALEVVDPPLLFLGGSDFYHPGPTQYHLIDPQTLTILDAGTVPLNNVTASLFADGGRSVYAASVQDATIARLDLTTSPPTWSTFAANGGPAHGLRLDADRNLLWTLTGPTNGMKDLAVFDVDPVSPSYGSEIGRAPMVSPIALDHAWDVCSATSRLVIYNGTSMLLFVDCDPQHATFLQVVDSIPVPGLLQGLNTVSGAKFTHDGSRLFVTLQVGFSTMPSGMHRYEIATGEWHDHNPWSTDVQPIGHLSFPQGLMVSNSHYSWARDESYAVFFDYNRMARVDLDRDDFTAWNTTTFPGLWSPDQVLPHTITADGSVFMIAPGPNGDDATMFLIDPFTGAMSPGVPLDAPSRSRTVSER